MFPAPQSYSFCAIVSSLTLLSDKVSAIDQDEDGMNDVWQKVYNIAAFDTLSDPDKDGKNNLEESNAGTNPNDNNDYYRIFNYQISPELNKVDLTWRSLEDRSYEIQESRNLFSWKAFDQTRGVLGNQSSISLDIPAPTPPNDNFESRLPTSKDAGLTTGSNIDATYQLGEPDDLFFSGFESVWWTWKATVAGEVTISTINSDFDATITVYTGDTLDTLVFIASSEDELFDVDGDPNVAPNSISFTADPTKVYSFQVTGLYGDIGNITLNHPPSAGTFDQPIPADGTNNKIFFRVKGNKLYDLDNDGDELVTWEERLLGTDPTKHDTDGDGMNDGYEFINDFDPINPADGALDADGDGISNADEIATGTDPRNPDSNGNNINDGLEDFDGDTLTNISELNIHNTDPANPDTDGDQMPDNWEVEYGLDPNDADGVNAQDGDPDGDGVSNFDEYLNGTDPNSKDTDTDGVDDDVEIDQGSDPNNSTDNGEPPKETLKELSFRIGDPSGSHSENWLLCIRGIGDDPDTRMIKVKGKDFGVMSDPTPFKLRVGKSYEITIQHLGTKPNRDPDYDWEATIDGLPGGVANVVDVGDVITENEVFIVGDYWIVDNREAVLTKLKNGNRTNIVYGKKTYLRPIEIVPDYNRDGKIELTDRGKVTTTNPWRWWINNDDDKTIEKRSNNENDAPRKFSSGDSGDLLVDGVRDLIDFFPLYLDLEESLKILPKTDYDYVLQHGDDALHYLEIKTSVIDGSVPRYAIDLHLKSYEAAAVTRDAELTLMGNMGINLSDEYLTLSEEGFGTILIEANKEARKPIILKIMKKSDSSDFIQIKLPFNSVHVEDMFRYINLHNLTGDDGVKPTNTNQPKDYPDELTNGKYLAYIHGYNVTEYSATGSQTNIFKRMHQLGSKARFIGIFWNGTPPPPLNIPQTLPPDYHKAVYNGFITGDALKDSLNFTQNSSLTLMAHSLGNIPASQAIANGGLQVDNYIMIDGAVPIEAYHANQTENSDNEDMSLRMTENDWKPYYNYGLGVDKGKQRRLLAANWYKLFDPDTDNRGKLTWRNIFDNPQLLSNAYNFYSTGEEVVENADAGESFTGNTVSAPFVGLTRHTWVAQEIAKGSDSSIASAAFDNLNGGWEFNYRAIGFSQPARGYYKFRDFPLNATTRKYEPSEGHEITDTQLRVKPFHRHFIYPDLYDPAKGSAEAGDDQKRYKILATGVPSMSFAIAANSLTKLDMVNPGENRNFNMQTQLKSDEAPAYWPELDEDHPNDWGHSDFKDVCIQLVYPMYEKIIELGKLKEN